METVAWQGNFGPNAPSFQWGTDLLRGCTMFVIISKRAAYMVSEIFPLDLLVIKLTGNRLIFGREITLRIQPDKLHRWKVVLPGPIDSMDFLVRNGIGLP
jgi:hypothetical protein